MDEQPARAPSPASAHSAPAPAVRSSLRDRFRALLAAIRGPSYWAARVGRLERGTAARLERTLRGIAGVSAAWVTPAIGGEALVSVRYDARKVSPAAFLSALAPLARSVSPIDGPNPGDASPEDQCVC